MDWTAESLMVLRALLATLLGAAVGLQRKCEGHEAGVRTHAVVALGACLFGVIGGDHRIAAQVVSGIGFIGAGVILHAGRQGHHVKGLTTAATLWATAALGLTVAYHHYLLAVFCTVLIVSILFLNRLPGWESLPPKGTKEAPKTDVPAPPADGKEMP